MFLHVLLATVNAGWISENWTRRVATWQKWRTIILVTEEQARKNYKLTIASGVDV